MPKKVVEHSPFLRSLKKYFSLKMYQNNNIDFSDFFSNTPDEWKNLILQELKNNSLEILTKSSESLTIKGFYSKEDIQDLSYLTSFHHHWISKSPRQWGTIQYIPQDKNNISETLIMSAEKGGINGYYFDIKNSTKSAKEILQLLQNVDKSDKWILARTESSFYELSECLKNVDKSIQNGLLFKKTNFSIPQNIIDNLHDLKKALALFQNGSNLKCLGIDGTALVTEAPSQIASILSFAIELIDFMTEQGYTIEQVLPHISFSTGIRDNYFIEIAKLRTLRLLWLMLVNEYSPNFDSFSTPVHCITLGASEIDANTNLLHHTTQAMSAIIGGCDLLTILPPDIETKEMNEFSSRIAKNISILLKEEAHLDYTVDPAAGSYMIESLTHQMAQISLEKIKTIEKHKGLISYLKGGYIV